MNQSAIKLFVIFILSVGIIFVKKMYPLCKRWKEDNEIYFELNQFKCLHDWSINRLINWKFELPLIDRLGTYQPICLVTHQLNQSNQSIKAPLFQKSI